MLINNTELDLPMFIGFYGLTHWASGATFIALVVVLFVDWIFTVVNTSSQESTALGESSPQSWRSQL